jgi:5-methyltetrahydrofolate--homocysteine methyltransferase
MVISLRLKGRAAMESQDNPFSRLLAEKGVLLADGATGTTLFDRGLTSGEAPELWNVSHPERIEAMHREFADAGADIILTNSFGGTRQRLKLHNAQDRVHELNRLAAELARKVADSAGRPVIVAGSVGPTGELFEPLGALTHSEAVNAFAEQMQGLKDGGADLIWIETMSAAEEIHAAGEAAARVGIPFVFTASFDTAGKTMMGLAPREIHRVADQLALKPAAVGANCGVGASDLLSSILDMSAADAGAILIAKANCGVPVVKGDQVKYSGTPELMADYTELAINAGAKVIGGCCGTTCEHLKEMRKAIDRHEPGVRPDIDEIVRRTGPLVNTTAAANENAPRRERRRRRSA